MKKLLLAVALFSGVAAAESDISFKPENQSALNNFVKSMLDNDKATFLKGGGSFIKVETASASELIAAYQKNELAANKKYKSKSVRVRTVANGINEDPLGNAYITANGKNSFENIMMYVNGDDERVLNISKKDKIDFVCNGDGFLLGSPILKRCVFTSDFITPVYEKVMTSASKASEAGYKPESVVEANVVLMYKFLEPEVVGACEKGSGDACVKAVQAAIKNGKFNKEMLTPYKPVFEGLPSQPRA